MRYVGICYDSGGWGGDLTGSLVGEFEDGWKIVASHISSGSGWSAQDIHYRFDHRDDASEADSYEWLGQLTVPEIEARFGWGTPDPGPAR